MSIKVEIDDVRAVADQQAPFAARTDLKAAEFDAQQAITRPQWGREFDRLCRLRKDHQTVAGLQVEVLQALVDFDGAGDFQRAGFEARFVVGQIAGEVAHGHAAAELGLVLMAGVSHRGCDAQCQLNTFN